MKKTVILYSLVAGCYAIGAFMSAKIVVPAMKRGLNYDDTYNNDVQDCPVEDVEPTA